MFTENKEINLPRTVTNTVFGLSKMTCPNENEDGPTEYSQIRFVEFIEMIGRAADYKYRDKKSWPLEQKCFHMIELLLKKEGIKPLMSYAELQEEKEREKLEEEQ